MEKSHKSNTDASSDKPTTKHGQIIELLQRHNGVSLEEMSTLANWLPHSTRAFLTGLKKKGHEISSDKVDGLRRYRIVAPVSQ
jgi:Protein of unknown function (DUF3489)